MSTWALKTKPRDGVWRVRTSVYFYVFRSSNVDKFKVVGCHGHNLNTDRKRRFFKLRKGIEQVLKEGIRSGLLSMPYKNGDQHYDVGPLCSIVITPCLGELNCDRLHIILIIFTYIITPLLLLPHINPCWHGPPLVLKKMH